MAEQPVNLAIMEGTSFYAHELSINFTPLQFTLDFKNITPRIDPRSKEKPTFVIQHAPVIVDPWHFKNIIEVMSTVLENYEKEFGKIKKPKQIVAAEKKHKKIQSETVKTEAPAYLG